MFFIVFKKILFPALWCVQERMAAKGEERNGVAVPCTVVLTTEDGRSSSCNCKRNQAPPCVSELYTSLCLQAQCSAPSLLTPISLLSNKTPHSDHAFRLYTQHQVTSKWSCLQALYSTPSHLIAIMPTGTMLNTRTKCFVLHEILTSCSLRWNKTLKVDTPGEFSLSVRLVLKAN